MEPNRQHGDPQYGELCKTLETTAAAGRAASRALISRLAVHYDRSQDLPVALAGNVRDYELRDMTCRWLTAGIMHRLCRSLRLELGRSRTRPDDPRILLLRKCLRGEAAIYLRQTEERHPTRRKKAA